MASFPGPPSDFSFPTPTRAGSVSMNGSVDAAARIRNTPKLLATPPAPDKAPLLNRPSESSTLAKIKLSLMDSASGKKESNTDDSPPPVRRSSDAPSPWISFAMPSFDPLPSTEKPVEKVEKLLGKFNEISSKSSLTSSSSSYSPSNYQKPCEPAPYVPYTWTPDDAVVDTAMNSQAEISKVKTDLPAELEGDEEQKASNIETVEEDAEEEEEEPELTTIDESYQKEGDEIDPEIEEILKRFRPTQTQDTIINNSSVDVLARRDLFANMTEKLAAPKTLADQLKESEAAAGSVVGGKIVLYTTSVGTVKETYSSCQELRKILQRCRVSFEERDVFLHSAFNKELQARLPSGSVPFVFFNGEPLGDYATILRLNENKILGTLFSKMPKIKKRATGECGQCGGAGFFTCSWCDGSKKSLSNRVGRSVISLKCTACNENGLMRCTACLKPYS